MSAIHCLSAMAENCIVNHLAQVEQQLQALENTLHTVKGQSEGPEQRGAITSAIDEAIQRISKTADEAQLLLKGVAKDPLVLQRHLEAKEVAMARDAEFVSNYAAKENRVEMADSNEAAAEAFLATLFAPKEKLEMAAANQEIFFDAMDHIVGTYLLTQLPSVNPNLGLPSKAAQLADLVEETLLTSEGNVSSPVLSPTTRMRFRDPKDLSLRELHVRVQTECAQVRFTGELPNTLAYCRKARAQLPRLFHGNDSDDLALALTLLLTDLLFRDAYVVGLAVSLRNAIPMAGSTALESALGNIAQRIYDAKRVITASLKKTVSSQMQKVFEDMERCDPLRKALGPFLASSAMELTQRLATACGDPLVEPLMQFDTLIGSLPLVHSLTKANVSAEVLDRLPTGHRPPTTK